MRQFLAFLPPDLLNVYGAPWSSINGLSAVIFLQIFHTCCKIIILPLLAPFSVSITIKISTLIDATGNLILWDHWDYTQEFRISQTKKFLTSWGSISEQRLDNLTVIEILCSNSIVNWFYNHCYANIEFLFRCGTYDPWIFIFRFLDESIMISRRQPYPLKKDVSNYIFCKKNRVFF